VILADTSVWIDHFRSGDKALQQALSQRQIAIHSWIIAELALGPLRERAKTLTMLDLLPRVRVAQLSEVRLMIEARRLYGLGIGLTDAQLIASIFLNPPTLLWTRDKPLRRVVGALGIHAALT
jgi:predicted nucleic acid-binding protein